VISPLDRLLDVVTALRPMVMSDLDPRPLKVWAELNVRAQHGCGGACGCTPQTCAHCQTLGEAGVAKVEEIFELLEGKDN